MNKVWYAWNGTFARSSILNYWTYSRNSKEAGEESSLRSSRISFKKFTLIKELSLLKVKAIGNILKVLFLLWWWDKMRSKVHQNHFLLSQVICNLLYIHRYRGLSSIDRFVLITKSSSILLSIPRLFFFICSALRRIQLRGSIDTAFCIWDISLANGRSNNLRAQLSTHFHACITYMKAKLLQQLGDPGGEILSSKRRLEKAILKIFKGCVNWRTKCIFRDKNPRSTKSLKCQILTYHNVKKYIMEWDFFEPLLWPKLVVL